jgi:hypothetical protein
VVAAVASQDLRAEAAVVVAAEGHLPAAAGEDLRAEAEDCPAVEEEEA